MLAGKDCGNGVVIDHGDGWETQYCHLKSGTVTVASGDRVAMGAALGEVGFSGRTQFPHLHLSVRHDGAVIDPFDAEGDETCGTDASQDDALWNDEIDYVAGGLVSVGLSTAVPEYSDIKSGAARRESIAADAPALVGWAQVFGGQSCDVVEIILTDPEGRVFHSRDAVLKKAQARLFRASGRKAPPGGWGQGAWTVTARLLRDGTMLDEMTGEARIAP